MFTRGNRELLNPNPTYGPEEPWTEGPNVILNSAGGDGSAAIGIILSIGSDQAHLFSIAANPFDGWGASGTVRFIGEIWATQTDGLINDGDEMPFVDPIDPSSAITVTLPSNSATTETIYGYDGSIVGEVGPQRELVPSDPTNSLQGTSNLFNESNGDLIFREVADGTSDLHFSQISGEFVPDET